MKILNQYYEDGIWLTGSFHNHTTNSHCGRFSVDTVYDIYKKFDFFAVSDHDKVTAVEQRDKGQVIYEGIEVSSQKAHMLLVNPPDNIMINYSNEFSIENYQKLSDKCIENGGISILCHPNRLNSQYWNIEDMLKLEGYTGIEVMSGCRDIVELDAAFDKWDILLSAGAKVWGFGNDDFHVHGQSRNVWNVVLAKERDKKSILEAIKSGCFYVSTGYGFNRISVEGSKIKIFLRSNEIIDRMYKYVTLFGKNGDIFFEKTGKFSELEYECKGNEGYIRIAAYLEGGYAAFSQPLFING